MKSQRLAVGLMIGQAILFAVETAMIHHIGPRGSAMQLALLRSGAGVMLVALHRLEHRLVRGQDLPTAATAAARVCVGRCIFGS